MGIKYPGLLIVFLLPALIGIASGAIYVENATVFNFSLNTTSDGLNGSMDSVQPRIFTEHIDSIFGPSLTIPSLELNNSLSAVMPRIFTEHIDSIFGPSLTIPSLELNNSLSAVMPRIFTEHIDSILIRQLNVTSNELDNSISKVKPRIFIESADMLWFKPLINVPFNITPPSTPPVPLIVSPSDGSIISGIVAVNATTSSQGINSASFEYTIDGLSWTLIGKDTNGDDGWNVLWDTTEVSDAVYTLRGVMMDVNGSSGMNSISVTVFNHPKVILTALPSRKTVENINASHSIGIFNSQYNVDTFDLTISNSDNAAVAALDQSSITIPPWSSKEVTLNVTDETPGEYSVNVSAISRSNTNITGDVSVKTMVKESFNISLIPIEGTRTSIGANITYSLILKNNQLYSDSFTLTSVGINPSWISLDASHILSSGEDMIIPIEISIPEAAISGDFILTISATSSNAGTTRSASLPLNIQNGPIITGLVPKDGSRLGSDSVIFTWTTNLNSTTKVILNQSGGETVYTGDYSAYHNIIVENLTRNQWYTYRAISNTSHGSTDSGVRSFYIDNGISFTQKIYNFSIERNYDQRATITVKNTDNEAHELLLTVNSSNSDLIVGFVGNGSQDKRITLAPSETEDVTLAIHAQDAMPDNYYLLLNLTADENLTDYAVANVRVRQPIIDLRLWEVSTDPLTLTKTLRLTNYGDTVTDLNIYADDGIKEKTIFRPIITHGNLGAGGSITFQAAPILTSDFLGMRGNITAEAAGKKTNLTVDYSLPAGKSVYFGRAPNVTLRFSDYFDNDTSPNTNPFENRPVESYNLNGSLIFFSQIIVDVFQDEKPVSNANVTLIVWNSTNQIVLEGVSDMLGKALFDVYGKAGNYSYKAMMSDYKLETETRNFSVNLHTLFELSPRKIEWVNVSDANATFSNLNETISLHTSPYIFRAIKETIGENDTFFLDLRWDLDSQKQVLIRGLTENNNIIFNTSGIPIGNYSATILSLNGSKVELSEKIHISANDVYAISKQENYTFWVPFPVNRTYMTTLHIEHQILSHDSRIVLELNDVIPANNESEYLFEYIIMSNETFNATINLTAETPSGNLIDNTSILSLQSGVPLLINVTIPVNYQDGKRVEQFNISYRVAGAHLQLNISPKINYIYEKKIWVGSDCGIFETICSINPYIYLWKNLQPRYKDVVITCGKGVILAGAIDASTGLVGIRYGKHVEFFVNSHLDVIDIGTGIMNKDIEGVAEGTLSYVGDFAILGGSLISEAPGVGFIFAAGRCLHNWHDVGVKAGIYDDIRWLGLYIDWKLHNWYCTNKPIINTSFPLDSSIKPSLSPTPNINDGYIVIRFTLPWPSDSYRSHNVNVYLNDIKIGSINNTIPEGHYTFRFDPSILNYADSGFASNKITVATDNLNGGHYVVATDIQVILPMKSVYMYVVANNQNEANEIIKNMNDAIRNKADLGIYSEDIKFSNLIPTSGTNVNINTTIINLGTNDAFNIPLQFFDNGVQMGENLTIGYIPSLSNITVNFPWNPTPGVHTISIRVNPDRRIDEPDYSNNEASKLITIGSIPDTTPPQSITNPSLQAAGTTWLNFTWLNPPDPDFSHVMLYLNGTFKISILAPQNYYNFTGLDPDTLYELGTHTVDSSGNVNETWVNATGRTAPLALESIQVTNPNANPAVILNDNGRARSPGTNITRLNVTVIGNVASVTIDLSPVGGSTSALMTRISGTDNYTITTNATSGINLTNNLMVNATDTSGNFNNSISIPLSVLLRGDIVRDNKIDLKDLLYMRRHLAGLEPSINTFVADIQPAEGDGKIDLKDLLLLRRYLAGLEPLI